MKLDLNLATRPAVNRTPLLLLVAVLATAALGSAAINLVLWLNTRAEARAVESQLAELEAEERALVDRRRELRARLEKTNLRGLDRRVASANSVLAEKSVTWTLLLDRLQELTPWQVRLVAVRTSLREDDVGLTLDLKTKQADYYWEFIRQLEAHDCFSNVYPSSQGEPKAGELEVTLQLDHDPWCGGENPARKQRELQRTRSSTGRRSRG